MWSSRVSGTTSLSPFGMGPCLCFKLFLLCHQSPSRGKCECLTSNPSPKPGILAALGGPLDDDEMDDTGVVSLRLGEEDAAEEDALLATSDWGAGGGGEGGAHVASGAGAAGARRHPSSVAVYLVSPIW
jgi:hypothetical protein